MIFVLIEIILYMYDATATTYHQPEQLSFESVRTDRKAGLNVARTIPLHVRRYFSSHTVRLLEHVIAIGHSRSE